MNETGLFVKEFQIAKWFDWASIGSFLGNYFTLLISFLFRLEKTTASKLPIWKEKGRHKREDERVFFFFPIFLFGGRGRRTTTQLSRVWLKNASIPSIKNSGLSCTVITSGNLGFLVFRNVLSFNFLSHQPMQYTTKITASVLAMLKPRKSRVPTNQNASNSKNNC